MDKVSYDNFRQNAAKDLFIELLKKYDANIDYCKNKIIVKDYKINDVVVDIFTVCYTKYNTCNNYVVTANCYFISEDDINEKINNIVDMPFDCDDIAFMLVNYENLLNMQSDEFEYRSFNVMWFIDKYIHSRQNNEKIKRYMIT